LTNNQKTMRALILEKSGEEPSLRVKDVPVPDLGPDEVLVQVAACGLCYHDIAVMRGVLRRGVKPDIVLGHEISGRVVETGRAVDSVGVGAPVVSALTTFCGRCRRCLEGKEYRCVEGRGIGHAIDGGFADFVKLPATSVLPVPEGISLEDAAVIACPIGVALHALTDVAAVASGDTVLVTGAGGGLGVHTVQVSSALGARVLAVTTSPEKVEQLERLTTAEVILADELDFAEIALAYTEDRAVDVVANIVGGAFFQSSIKSLTQFGRVVLLGEVTGERAGVNIAEILFRDATIVGSTGANPGQITAAAQMVAAGLVRPVISQRFTLEDAPAAYRLMRAGKTFGRVILVP